jgi:hypothetical protein
MARMQRSTAHGGDGDGGGGGEGGGGLNAAEAAELDAAQARIAELKRRQAAGSYPDCLPNCLSKVTAGGR